MLAKLFLGVAVLATLFMLIVSLGFFLGPTLPGDLDIVCFFWVGVLVLWFMWGVLNGLNKRKV